MTPALREQARKAVQVITADGHQLSAGRAILFALEAIEWHPSLVRLAGRHPFIWAIELGYWIVARNRSFFGRFLFRSESSELHWHRPNRAPAPPRPGARRSRRRADDDT